MEKRSKSGRTQIVFLFLIILQIHQQITTTSPIPPHSEPIFSQSPAPSPPITTSQRRHHHLRSIILGLLFGCLTGFLASLAVVFSIRRCLFYANRTPILAGPVVFSPNISPKNLQRAVSDNTLLTNLLGSSSTGKYYRVTLDDGLVVAAKRVEPNCPDCSPALPQRDSAKRRVQQGLEMLAMVRHRHVMSLRAYVRDRDRFSLVYDFVPGGSLEDALNKVRANKVRMGWEVRHRIAIGVVKGLRYLHFDCNPRILHYNLKPGNVLLDDHFEPRLGDCGVARLLCGDSNGGAEFSCYAAPECSQGCRYTDKCDIFSFGVILAMLLTGRDPSDPLFGGGSISFGRWLRHLQQAGEAKPALDRGIICEECEIDEILMAVRIAVVCLSDIPADRPSSDELVAMLMQLHSF